MKARPGKRIDRPHQLKIKVSSDEKQWLETMATAYGLTVSDWLRMRIRDAHSAHEARMTRIVGGEDD